MLHFLFLSIDDLREKIRPPRTVTYLRRFVILFLFLINESCAKLNAGYSYSQVFLGGNIVRNAIKINQL